MIPTQRDKEKVFPRKGRRCPKGYKFDGENCVYNEKSLAWKGWTVSPKRRRVQVYQILNVLERKGLLKNVVDTLQSKLGIENSENNTMAKDLVAALNRLDRSFSEANWKELKRLLKFLLIHDIKVIKVSPEDFYDENNSRNSAFITRQGTTVLLLQGGGTTVATNKIYLDAKYKGSDAVLKLLGEYGKYTVITQVNAIMESIVNICVSAVLRDEFNRFISAPDVLTMGWVKGLHKYQPNERGLVLVQEKVVNATTFRSLDERYFRKAFTTLCRGLSKLQQEYNFAHRDFHCENVMYDISKDKVYIIDFGMSCFSIPKTKGSLQLVSTDFLWDPFEQQEHKPCVNKSVDICNLILSLIAVRKLHENPIQSKWIRDLARMISNKYKEAFDNIYDTEIFQKYYVEGYENIDDDIYDNAYLREWQWENPIIHYWYTYKLFLIDINFTPKELLSFLSDLEDTNGVHLEDTNGVQPNLKF